MIDYTTNIYIYIYVLRSVRCGGVHVEARIARITLFVTDCLAPPLPAM